jgi:hypothetical protein
MEYDSLSEQTKDSDPLPDVRNVFQSFWFRCAFQNGTGFNGKLLESYWDLLLCSGSILWTIFLFFWQ